MTVRYSHLTPKHTLAAVEKLAGVLQKFQLTPKLAPRRMNRFRTRRPMSTKSFRCGIL
jgi:hypothetical protein